MNRNIWDFGDLGEAWHAIWSGHRRRRRGMPGFPQIPQIQNIVIHIYIIVFHGYPNLSNMFSSIQPYDLGYFGVFFRS